MPRADVLQILREAEDVIRDQAKVYAPGATAWAPPSRSGVTFAQKTAACGKQLAAEDKRKE